MYAFHANDLFWTLPNILCEQLWELKMRQSGALMGGAVHEPEPAATTPAAQKPGAPQPSPNVHDLNVPYEATEDYEAPEDDMPYPPVSWLDDYFQCSLLWFLCVCDVLMWSPI